jgi:hypothetical protein
MVTCHLHNRAPTGLVRRAGVCPLCDIRPVQRSLTVPNIPSACTDSANNIRFVLILH